MAKLWAFAIGFPDMPTKVRTLRPRLAPTRRDVRRAADERRRASQPWRALYQTPLWRGIREDQLTREPLCRMCLAEGRVTPASVCDHVERHRGDPVKFFAGPFQSLCKHHHDSAKQRGERAEDNG